MQGPRAGRADAAEVVWNWRDPRPQQAADTPSNRPRLRGSLQAAAAAAVGSAFWYFGSPILARVILSVAGGLLLAALLAPRTLYAAIERLFLALGRITAQAITWLLLVPVFYLFFAPFGMLLRRGRRDRLRRNLEPDSESYWEPHEGITAASGSHERQY